MTVTRAPDAVEPSPASAWSQRIRKVGGYGLAAGVLLLLLGTATAGFHDLAGRTKLAPRHT